MKLYRDPRQLGREEAALIEASLRALHRNRKANGDDVTGAPVTGLRYKLLLAVPEKADIVRYR